MQSKAYKVEELVQQLSGDVRFGKNGLQMTKISAVEVSSKMVKNG
jgi:hypothetical protein